jgi:hypothetical protein
MNCKSRLLKKRNILYYCCRIYTKIGEARELTGYLGTISYIPYSGSVLEHIELIFMYILYRSSSQLFLPVSPALFA